ncbi:hypothetical protein SLEP1_g55169 [Rubroshorea leprosula]|uniref:TIR domain-containing protein n=1 Tax=Rubroshorea leprosula TaxID=152421 RepID=A0AAV5MFS8_9ROSI|nr:hypothetical protein SLEP1_g55169 [Rubroshorea leprosula]
MAASFPSKPSWDHDVFLSFRGEDVRKTFLGHLYSALNRVGFRTYKDDNELERGSDIAPSLLEAIEHSRIAIVVFSENYADSRWCLDELVKILDCRDKLGQMVLPVFFHVDPSDVRNQRGIFGKAFACHQKVTTDKVERWKTALTNAANLAGFDIQSVNGDESELIKKIIEDVWEKVDHTYLSDVDGLFGIDSPVEKIISLLRLDSTDVQFIGIYGMPGIGKTTVAEVIRNRISKEFDDGCGFHTKINLRSLIQKCLLTIRGKKLGMHDLLQEMAREIVREENRGEPGERSRLSFYKDVRKVLKHHKGTNRVIGLKGFFPETREKPFSIEALARMSNIRMLQLRNADFVGSFEYFSKELRWLCWERYPQVSIPSSLNLKNLVVLSLRNSKLKYIWDVSKVLKNLKVLDLSHSHDLIGTSDISGLLNIEKLIFKGCINLIEVHQSIGNLSKLIYLDLVNCQNLVHLPTEICKLRFLENLNLYLCSKLEELPEDFGNMESLKELNIGCTAIKHLPMSIGHLKNLTNFFWSNGGSLLGSPGIYNLSPLWSLTSVKELNLSFCKLSENSFPRDLSGLQNLETLLLKGNAFQHLPIFLSNLPKLKELDVSECDLSDTSGPLVVGSPFLWELNLCKNNFCSLPVDLTSLPLNTRVSLLLCNKLKVIEFEPCKISISYHCKSLEKVTFKRGLSDSSARPIFCSHMHCYDVEPLTGKQLAKLEHLLGLKASLKKCSHFFRDFIHTWSKDRPIQGFPDYMEPIYNIFLPEGTMPCGFNHEDNVACTIVDVPRVRVSSRSFQGLAVCVICHIIDPDHSTLAITIEDEDFSRHYHTRLSPPFEDHKGGVMWVSCWRTPSLVNECKRFNIKVKTDVTDGSNGSHFWIVKRIGFRLLSEEELDRATDIWGESIRACDLGSDPPYIWYLFENFSLSFN